LRRLRRGPRGTGLSQRDVAGFSLDSFLADLEAVADRLGLERFALWGFGDSGPVAISYAARYPERVSHLLLWCTWARTSDPPWVEALDELMKKDWEAYTETVAHGLLGWSAAEEAGRIAALIREAVTPETALAAASAGNALDAVGLLSSVRSPTLVLHRRLIRWPEVDVARGLGSRIPDARLALLEGESPLPQLGDTESVLQAIDEFLGEGEETAAGTAPQEPSAFRTVLFTDIVGHTEMMSRLGDERGREVLRGHERITRDVLKQHGGTEVKTMGDGFMASFGSVTKAVECAVALQRAFAGREGEPLSVRIGLNAGEPIEEEGDLFGATVILASRIAAKAEGGEILVADTVRGLCSGKGFLFADRGEFVAKGFEEPVRLFEVRWREE